MQSDTPRDEYPPTPPPLSPPIGLPEVGISREGQPTWWDRLRRWLRRR